MTASAEEAMITLAVLPIRLNVDQVCRALETSRLTIKRML